MCVLALTLLGAGCGGDEDDASDAPAATTEAATTTPDDQEREEEEIARAVFERSYTECASFELDRLAAKYKVPRNASSVSLAVARAWAREFGGGELAVGRGRAGCLQGMRHRESGSE